MSDQFIVSGQIKQPNAKPLSEVIVRAFDKDLPSLERQRGSGPEELGNTTTDADGFFEITYAAEQFRKGEGTNGKLARTSKIAPDLTFRVFNQRGQELKISKIVANDKSYEPSQIIFNAPAETKVVITAITVEQPKQAPLSEYEDLLSQLAPILEYVLPADLTDEDLTFLDGETDIEPQRLKLLRQAAQLARNTKLPAEGFYGLGRRREPMGLDKLIAVPDGKLREALLTALKEKIIPAKFRDQIASFIRQLKRHNDVSYQAALQLLDQKTGSKLPGYTVRVFDADSGKKPKDLGSNKTNGEGMFTLSYLALSVPPTKKLTRKFLLKISNPDGKAIAETTVEIKVNQQDALQVRITVPTPKVSPSPAISKLAESSKISIPKKLQTFLAKNNIRTLADIGKAGGLIGLQGLPVAPNDPAVKMLEAHADLGRLSPDVQVNAALIAKGYTSALAIANAPMSSFVSAARKQLGGDGAAAMHVAAKAQVNVLNNILKDIIANPLGNVANDQANELKTLGGLGGNYCQCDDCQAATSPAAYLADLLSYALKHLVSTIPGQQAGVHLNVEKLERAYRQPFSQLPTDCDAVNRQVRQVRICVEVLRGITHPSTDLDKEESAYRLAAYTALLTKLGVTYQEIRLARSAKRLDREALAERLGITIVPLGSVQPDQLEKLFLDPSTTSTTTPAPLPEQLLTEANLESLFGLVDTQRDPLSDGPTIGDSNATITRWNLKGVEWGRNTDSDGRIYVNVKQTNPGEVRVELYRDPPQSQLVASAEETLGTPLSLAEENGSGLTGQMIVSYFGNASGIVLRAMPQLMAWRCSHLRPQWEEEDRPTDAYREGRSAIELQALPTTVHLPPPLPLGIGYDSANRMLTFGGVMTPEEKIQRRQSSAASDYQTAIMGLFVESQRPPMIDPDVIGPDDFRVPFQKSAGPDKAFDWWLKRRAWVDKQLATLATMVKVVNGAPDMDKMIDSMYPLIGAASVVGWDDTTKKISFSSIQDDLTQGVNVEAAKLRLASDLSMTVSGFLRLMTIWDKDKSGMLDARIQVSADEWDEVRSILVQSQKTRLFATWRKEEESLGVPFSGEDFWISLGEPQSGAWPPALQPPLIDPELVKETDLVEATVGKAAHSIWHERVKELAAITVALRAAREQNGFDSMVALAIGPLPESFDQLNHDLQSNNPTVVANAIAKVTNALCMTVDSFNRLMEIKIKASDSNPLKRPTVGEWTEAYQILTSAQKQKKLYPTWISKEAGAPLSYWNALKAKLPPWRASAESRQTWQTTLRNRTAAPIIDPDLVNLGDLINPVSGNAAYDIWSLRNKLLQVSATPTTLAGLDAMINADLGVAGPELETLEADEQKGNSIDGRLDQLNLTAEALSQLLHVRELLQNSAPVVDSEWNDVYSILAQVVKVRQNAGFRHAEAGAHITLTPDFFQVQADPATGGSVPLPQWRTSWEDRSRWQDTLQARIDEENVVVAAVSQAADAAEGATLEALRDALVAAPNAIGDDLAVQAEFITKKLLIDARQSACKKTTRIEQALETLQDLMWGLRTGEIDNLYVAAQLDDPGGNFDEEWKWMGTYAAWRSAILVWMYPENILQPTLRKLQTPGFQKLVQDVRANPRLSPDDACKAARNYSDYFRDVCTLIPAASSKEWARVFLGDDCQRGRNEDFFRWLVFMFGIGGWTGRAYWSVRDAYSVAGVEPPAGRSQTFWATIPGLDQTTVKQIVGAETYRPSTGGRYLYVFAVVADKGTWELLFTRYDVDNALWDGAATPLDLPPNSSSFEVVLRPQSGDGDPPRFRVKDSRGSIYERALNRQGRDWAVGDWTPLIFSPWASIGLLTYGAALKSIVAVAHHPSNPDMVDLFATGEDKQVYWTWWDSTARDWHSWLIVDRLGLIPPGARITAVRTASEMVLLVFDKNGNVCWTNRSPSDSDWYYPLQHIPTPHPHTGFSNNFAPGTEITVLVDEHDTLHLFACSDEDVGLVQTCTLDVKTHSPGGWSYVGNQQKTNGSSVVAGTYGPSFNIFVVAPAGGLDWEIRGGRYVASDFSASMPSSGTEVPPNTTLTAISREAGRVELFFVGLDGGIYKMDVDNTGPTTQFKTVTRIGALSVPVASRVTAVARTSTRIDLFVVGNDGAVYSNWLDGNINDGLWNPNWFRVGNQLDIFPKHSIVSVVARGSGHLDIFTVGRHSDETVQMTNTAEFDGEVYFASWDQDNSLWPPVQPPPSFTGYFPVNPGGPFDIPIRLSNSDLQARQPLIKQAFDDNKTPASNRAYIEEAYYFVPMFLASELRDAGEFTAALDLYRTVYDYTASAGFRKICDGMDYTGLAVFTRQQDWLLDQLNPHAIAATRRNTYIRYTLLSIVRCLLDFADADFTFDTSESDETARALYITALGLLSLPEFNQSQNPCEGLLIALDAKISSSMNGEWKGVWTKLMDQMGTITDLPMLAAVIPKIEAVILENAGGDERFSRARTLIANAKAKSSSAPTIGDIGTRNQSFLSLAYPKLLGIQSVTKAVDSATRLSSESFTGTTQLPASSTDSTISWGRSQLAGQNKDEPTQDPLGPPQLPGTGELTKDPTTVKPDYPSFAPSYWFCTPPNPMIAAFRHHAELNLYKLRHCLNIAGLHRELEPYSAPTDSTSGLPTIGAGGRLVISTGMAVQPTAYHYATLIDRAKQLVQFAAQMEASMLSAIEKKDAEAYNLFRARQDVHLTAANVQLLGLQVTEAQAGVQLAQLQQDKARVQTDHWQSLLSAGMNEHEKSNLALLETESDLQVTSAVLSVEAATVGALSINNALQSGAYALSSAATAANYLAGSVATQATIASTSASYERRSEEWAFNRSLAVQDQAIARGEIAIATDHVSVVQQQQNISQIQADNAVAGVDFLSNKFTNVELYAWMSGVLQRVYSFFLQQATAMAKLAENQLSFERQEVPSSFIQPDYWTDPTDGTQNTAAPDRRGLTGSARLLEDITQLDQYAFLKNERKLQLTKTISLLALDPYEFQRFRETGVMNFTTPMEMFDRDFPGHTLRLIKRVRTSVIALIPPSQGIRATLSTTAVSRVVIGSDGFYQTAVVRRDPQFVALSSPINATGLFELDAQSELLLPFEGLGVDTHWELRMPKAANPFDFRSIADVFITIDHTAVDRYDYRDQVLRRLNNRLSANRPFSFRNELADPWYDLHNPDQTATPMTVRFETARDDFPPNLENLSIQHVTFYFARADGKTFEVPISSLDFTEAASAGAVGGAANSIDGMINTRNGNAASWTPMLGKTPVGKWELALPNRPDIRNRFKNEEIEDILFVITYAGHTPEWPS